ncbi:hypothetical protein DRE_03925 [Drechslerella stenobrocha 248]|uniref:Glutamate pyruvate transaminase n=1 Tax=Drechslerella stenobrocha 248 TaxID=1043628 RepID=W7I3X5_9PEZI|nr:hypothetical protein DRE_03925 [Drechslerella stenobrocha 248]
MSSTSQLRSLNYDNINPHVKEAKYAVRGELANKAESIRRDLEQDPSSHPFDHVIFANIGNPQQLDQKPITFFRQVLSLIQYPDLLNEANAEAARQLYPEDALERARWLLKSVKSVGAYSHSQGAPALRNSVARYIEQRDGHPADPESIYLTTGASSGVNTLLHVVAAGPNTGVMIPIPQYPLYTATLALLNAKPVEYYLEEPSHWSTDCNALYDVWNHAQAEGTDVRCICVINPGNPTGASLPYKSIEDILTFAAEKKLVVMADEVYQTNVFIGEFVSFKKVLRDLQKKVPGKYDNVELVSFHSTSKGMVGECGQRGGYFELVGFDPKVVAEIYKFVSISLCPPVGGQCLVEMMVNPPKEGEPSHALYKKEYDAIYNGLKTRAYALHDAFKHMEGVESQDPQGAMYMFPTIKLSQKAVEAAEKEGRKQDEFYCMELLKATGVCVVPGSGFGQKDGTWHFRTTFLAPGTDWVGRIVDFHKGFMDKYRD